MWCSKLAALALLACAPAAAAITEIGHNNTFAGSHTTITVTTTAGCAVGASVVGFMSWDSATAPSFSATDNASGAGSGSNSYSGFGSVFLMSGSGNYTQFLSSDNIGHGLLTGDHVVFVSTVADQFNESAIVLCVTGEAASPRDLAAAGQTNGGFNTAVVSGTFTTNASFPNEIVLVGMAFASGATITAGTNYTAIFSNVSFSEAIEYRIISSQLSSSTATATISSGNNNWGTTVLSLTQAAAGGAVQPRLTLVGVGPD